MGQRNIKTVINEKDLAEPVALLHVLHILHHRIDGPNDTPGVRICLDLRSRGGISKAAQLGQYPNTKTGLGIFLHVQFLQARRGGEGGGTAATVDHELTTLTIHYAREV